MKVIIVFKSVHYTIKADNLLREKGLKYQIITTPREISTDCGMSIETDLTSFKDIELVLLQNQFEYQSFKGD
ncbi:MAG: DUF3343 domain-containing protein [Candidatus Cloacimonetes bacterium]|jgi:hypothetical protein|nr:DUF3343 domain-containing protein [Candidatus Cloacimonadota bacterium]MDD4156271.1 DUF3343 domain-containing protein [Candidatus Cloacimonadota bacterium]